jgi:hypothetical protein
MVNEQANNADTLAARCATCQCVAACKWTFRDFWARKSGGGEGCNCPMTPTHACAVERVIENAERRKAEAEARAVQDEIAAAKAERECAFAPRAWIVTHLRRTYETTAKTSAQAVNNVRFQIYGTRPLNTLAPFHAEPKRTGNISISSAARRLAALAQNRT